MHSEQKVLFKDQTATGVNQSKPVFLNLRGIRVNYVRDKKPRVLVGVPSFKTGKTAVGWWDKVKQKVMARPMTLPEHSKWMELATLAIESQLRSTFQITDERIRTVACPRSWIASLVPLDDCWTWCADIQIRPAPELCEPGSEGAEVLIERIA